MPKLILKRFTVEGSGDFPFDMLRSDRCWPAAAGAVARIGANYGTADREGLRGRIVALETAEKYAPNRQRWASFGWSVVD